MNADDGVIARHTRIGFAEFNERYNRRRPYWALVPGPGDDPVTPKNVYVKGINVQIPRWQTWAKAAKDRLDQMMTA